MRRPSTLTLRGKTPFSPTPNVRQRPKTPLIASKSFGSWNIYAGEKEKNGTNGNRSSPAKVHKSRSWSPTWPVRKILSVKQVVPQEPTHTRQRIAQLPENPCDSRSPESLRSDILGMCDACKCQNPDRMLRVQQDRFHLPFPAVQGNAHVGRGLVVALPPGGVKFFLRNFPFSRRKTQRLKNRMLHGNPGRENPLRLSGATASPTERTSLPRAHAVSPHGRQSPLRRADRGPASRPHSRPFPHWRCR